MRPWVWDLGPQPGARAGGRPPRRRAPAHKTGGRSRPPNSRHTTAVGTRLPGHQHAVDHVHHAVALADVRGGHLRGAALAVGQGDAAHAIRLGGEGGALHGGQGWRCRRPLRSAAPAPRHPRCRRRRGRSAGRRGRPSSPASAAVDGTGRQLGEASSVGANTVNGPAPCSVPTRSAAFTAATRVLSSARPTHWSRCPCWRPSRRRRRWGSRWRRASARPVGSLPGSRPRPARRPAAGCPACRQAARASALAMAIGGSGALHRHSPWGMGPPARQECQGVRGDLTRPHARRMHASRRSPHSGDERFRCCSRTCMRRQCTVRPVDCARPLAITAQRNRHAVHHHRLRPANVRGPRRRQRPRGAARPQRRGAPTLHRLVVRGGGMQGRKFDSSKDRGEALHLPLGAGMVIKGWDEACRGCAEGGRRMLVIPAASWATARAALAGDPAGRDPAVRGGIARA